MSSLSGFVVLTIETILPEILQEHAKRMSKSDSGVLKNRNGIWFYERYIFIKPHGGGDGNEKKTLFAANIPLQWTTNQTKDFFKKFGSIESVDHGNATNCKFARVSFKKSKSVQLALTCDSNIVLDDQDEESKTKDSNKPKWLTEYNMHYPKLETLKEEAETYMTAFAQAEQEEEERRKKLEREVDDDGFTVVRYKKSSKPQTTSELAQASIGSKYFATTTGTTEKIKSGKKKVELQNFYRYQMREKKREQLVELRKKFEEDKMQIERLKASRKFRPF